MIAEGYRDAIELLREQEKTLDKEGAYYTVQMSVVRHARWYLEREFGRYLTGHVVRID